ncbi:MAG TPA: MG2 domain-containing protein [Kofleriaceae bacterium]|nr:MG2 domain-containing protein [Kofleriaceae bacterium]
MKTWQKQVVVVVAVAAFIGLLVQPDDCEDAWLRWGLTLHECPVGQVRQTASIEVASLRRGADGSVFLSANAHYTTRDADSAETVPVTSFRSIELSLLDAKGAATPLSVKRWEPSGDRRYAQIKLPEVPDGDYRLRAKYETRLGAGELEVPIPLYTPARIHVITDRPLYEPGNVVRFRAVALRARDLAPLDHRPGAWVITDPNGEVMLEEKAPAGDWGIVAGSFPLDRGAPSGAWKVEWRSAQATDAVTFTVQPFTLPRFRVEATTDAAFYRANESPVIRGAVLYSSGAPVPKAAIDIQWNLAGAWPAPLEWEEKLLPKRAITGDNGRFELALPKIPPDLQGKVTMTAHLSAVDPAGDRAVGVASVLLSEDGIDASAVTELGAGLVPSFNNRLYVRVTTPSGREVAGAKINVRRAWQPDDKGYDALLDEDGVASLQVDPGPPVNVVIPAAPFRPAPREQLVTRGEVRELIGGEGAPLADQVELDRWLPALEPCAKWFDADSAEAALGLRVDRGGAVVAVAAGTGALERCVAGVVRGRRLPAGPERMYALAFTFSDPGLSSLGPTVESTLEEPTGLTPAVAELSRGARDCLPAAAFGQLPRALSWRVRAGTKVVELGPWIDDPSGEATAAAAVGCAAARFAGARVPLAEPAESDSMGLVRFSVAQAEAVTQARPQPTTMLGYELIVTADLPGKPSTKLRLSPGTVPDLRLRVAPVLAKPGDTVTAQLIRGPEFRGVLPKKLEVVHLKGQKEVDVGKEQKASATIDPGTEGWVEIRGGGVRALVFVKPAQDLAVSLAPAQDRYKPGDKAQLQLRTLVGGKGGKAAVGLFGVDDSLAQLAPLAGPGDMARVQPKVETSAPAFGTLDGQALTLGRIRGANAAAATVLRVSEIPKPPDLDAYVNASARSTFDPVVELTDSFYFVLTELHTQVRAWEASAPPDEKMQPATMARLWTKALEACERRQERVTDAYGRRLKLSRLPSDLLTLTDPRAVVVVGTRLPEDVENWAQWIARERP